MSHNLDESDAYEANVIVPDVGDTTYVSTVPQGMGNLANRTNFLWNRLVGGGETEDLNEADATAAEPAVIVPADSILPSGNVLKDMAVGLASRIKYVKGRAHGLANYSVFVPAIPFGNPAGWNFTASTGAVSMQQDDTSAVAFAHFSVPLVTPGPTTRLVTVRAYVRGSSHASLPTTMPKLQIYARSHSLGGFGGGDVAEIGSQSVDTSSSSGNYDVFHYIDWTAPASTFVHNHGELVILFHGEEATGSEDFRLFGFRVFLSPAA